MCWWGTDGRYGSAEQFGLLTCTRIYPCDAVVFPELVLVCAIDDVNYSVVWGGVAHCMSLGHSMADYLEIQKQTANQRIDPMMRCDVTTSWDTLIRSGNTCAP